jgi:cell division protein FtsI (penicillin-binding protein 3)
MSLIHTGLATPGWRWIKDRLWGLERAFEKTRASGRAEDDTRIRILVLLALFVVGFASLAVGATRRALVQGPEGAGLPTGYAGPGRAPLVDRRGSLLAADLPYSILYLDPHDVWDKAEVRRGLIATLPGLPVARLDKALNGSRRTLGGASWWRLPERAAASMTAALREASSAASSKDTLARTTQT